MNYTRARLLGLPTSPGIHALPQKSFLALWAFFRADTKYAKEWLGLELDKTDFESIYQALNFDVVSRFIREHGPIGIEENNEWRKDRSGFDFFKAYTEKSNYTYSYALIFSKFLSHRVLPTAIQYADRWLHYNEDGVKKYCSGVIYDEIKSKFPHYTREAIITTLKQGLIYRAKRNCSAFLRELHAVASLATKVGEEDYQQELCVIVHPLLDYLARLDAIVVLPNNRIVGIAIMLESQHSEMHSQRKSKCIPQCLKMELDKIVDFPISRGDDKGIFVAKPEELDSIRKVLFDLSPSTGGIKHYSYKNKRFYP